MEFIKRKGGTVLLFAGHQYYKLRPYKDGSEIWRCSNYKKEKCTGTIKIKVTHFHICYSFGFCDQRSFYK